MRLHETPAGLHLDPVAPALGDSQTYLNYAVWESSTAFRAAFTNPDFQAKLSVPDICGA
jgi:hypothetical protein